MVVRKFSALLVLLFAVCVLLACGDPEETCVCTCTCGSGAKTTLDNATSEDDCLVQCDEACGTDSFTTNYDCQTKG